MYISCQVHIGRDGMTKTVAHATTCTHGRCEQAVLVPIFQHSTCSDCRYSCGVMTARQDAHYKSCWSGHFCTAFQISPSQIDTTYLDDLIIALTICEVCEDPSERSFSMRAPCGLTGRLGSSFPPSCIRRDIRRCRSEPKCMAQTSMLPSFPVGPLAIT